MLSYPILTLLLAISTALSILFGQTLGFAWSLFFGWWSGWTLFTVVDKIRDYRRKPRPEPWNDD